MYFISCTIVCLFFKDSFSQQQLLSRLRISGIQPTPPDIAHDIQALGFQDPHGDIEEDYFL